jgi:hypothetical protein
MRFRHVVGIYAVAFIGYFGWAYHHECKITQRGDCEWRSREYQEQKCANKPFVRSHPESELCSIALSIFWPITTTLRFSAWAMDPDNMKLPKIRIEF